MISQDPAERLDERPRVCVFGAGAIGAQIAVRLSQAGVPVCVVARGAHLAAIRARGLTLRAHGRDEVRAQLAASDDPRTLGRQDFVVFAVKKRDLHAALEAAAPMLAAGTRAIFAMNGLPWWFLRGLGVTPTPELIACLGEAGAARSVPLERWISCVVTLGGRVVAPGVVLGTTPGENGLCLGYADGRVDEAIERFAALARAGGFGVRVSTAIRRELWAKLLVNAGIAPVATVADRTVSETCADPETRNLVIRVMEEILATGRALGLEVDADPAQTTRPDRAPPHVPSLLQDLRAGRALEIDNGILAVRALARILDVPAPHLEAVAALLSARAAGTQCTGEPESQRMACG